MATPASSQSVLIFGGAGFIGTNLARSFLETGRRVHIFDNLSRPGVERNIQDLASRFPSNLLEISVADVRDVSSVSSAVDRASAVFHLAAQVAVTTSIATPMTDAEVNLLGTLNILEAVRKTDRRPPFLFTSTNKVYGKLQKVALREQHSRWIPADNILASSGISEEQGLEFLSPYGCSKGSADQYVLDYANTYDMDTVVFRMSCIYGPYQVGSEDQGWVAHFVRQALKRLPITVYGDGKQVRDLLYVQDLIEAMRLATEQIQSVRGTAFNIGGGVANSSSLKELLKQLEALLEHPVNVEYGPERLADQKWYVANCGKIERALCWRPTTSVSQGLSRLIHWSDDQLTGLEHREAQVA